MTTVVPGLPRRRLAPVMPLVSAVAGVGGLVVVAAVDPAERGSYLRCPLHAMTGLWCPGCGATRATHRVLHGDILGALGANLFLPVFAALIVLGWLTWFLPTLGRRPPQLLARAPAWAWAVLGGALLAFGVVRNLPFAVTRALAP